MATIRPFKPIRPNPLFADQLVFAKPQAESVAGEHILPLKTLLETGARLRPETPEGQALAYQDIKETLHHLLEQGRLLQEDTQGFFIYEVTRPAYSQTGIWALADLTDYTRGHIKIHERTFADSVRRIKNYREHTGLEGSPILLAYPPDEAINAIIAAAKTARPQTSLGNEQGLHRLWKIGNASLQRQLAAAFALVKTVYLADGHHRITGAAELNDKHISALYMATDQLRIEPYHRVVVPDSVPEKPRLFEALDQHFYLRKSNGNQPVEPKDPHRMGMYLDGEWYHLFLKPGSAGTDQLDAAHLQELVLSPVFGIRDPRTDGRLKCAGGEKALEEMGAIFQAHPAAIAFTLCPLTTSQLVKAADAGQILPPKATWIVPKIPYGLLIYRHQKI